MTDLICDVVSAVGPDGSWGAAKRRTGRLARLARAA